ncbi:archaellin/type IV pilin N-terminal domain-containing protein [Methanofollis ethanolicus]|uniref:archaellin/type IV pilin N-terminal domain-containing protein n=1 Tax=Methanofollis ethanolicus TaxID=488124 RepID=UPI00082BE7D5|nr:flagellin [Methanofollis ethanolicus]
MRKFGKNDEAFTGLEAAIVLIAFVVVAAVFSYMMLGAGFFTSQKSQEVVHTATSQTSSSVDLAGSVVVIGGASDKLANATFYLQLTSGGTPVDLSRTAYAVTTDNAFVLLNSTQVGYTWYNNDTDTDSLLEAGELVKVNVPLDTVSVSPKQVFTIDVKPSVGAALSLARTAPTRIVDDRYYEVY